MEKKINKIKAYFKKRENVVELNESEKFLQFLLIRDGFIK